jgi:hypothetical protein
MGRHPKPFTGGRFQRTDLDGRNGFREVTFAGHALGARNSVSPAVRRRRKPTAHVMQDDAALLGYDWDASGGM